MSAIPARVVLLATAALCIAYRGRAGDVVVSEANDWLGIVEDPAAAPVRLDTSITAFAGTVGSTGRARTITYSITGLRAGQRAAVTVSWGNRTASETLTPTLGGSSPAGSAILGAPGALGSGTCAFLSGAANNSGVATVDVTLTASGAASFDVFAFASAPGTDVSDVQTVAFT